MNNVRSIENLTEAELKHNIFGGVSKGSWHEKYKNSAWVFLGGLPFELTEGDVICVMSQWGEIEDIHLVREKDTGKSRGFAFIKYEDSRSTILAVDNINGAKLLGQTLRCDHVDQYRLPKEVQEREAEQWEEQGGGSIDIGPGHAYKGKELANDFDISNGVNLWSSSSSKQPKKPSEQVASVKEDYVEDIGKEEIRNHDMKEQRVPSRSPSPPRHKTSRCDDDRSQDHFGGRKRNERYHSDDDDSCGRSRSRSRERKHDKKKDKKHKKHRKHHRDSRTRSEDRFRRRRDKYDDFKDEKNLKDNESRDNMRDRRGRSRSRDERRYDKDDGNRNGRSHRDHRSVRSDSRESNHEHREKTEGRSTHYRDNRNDSDDNESIDSRSLWRQREEMRKRAEQKELEKAMLAAAMTATEVLGPSATGGASTAHNNSSSNTGNGLILSGGGPVASWRGRRDPEIRARLAAAEKKLSNASSSSSGLGGVKGSRDDVSGIGGARRIR